MANALNPRSLANIVERNIGDRIWQCDDEDLILINLLGGMNGAEGKFGFMNPSDVKIEWMDTGNRPTGTTLTTAITAPASLGLDCFNHNVYPSQDIVVADAGLYAHGMVLEFIRNDLLTPEFIYVNSVNLATNTLNVVRGWRGTPVYAYAIGQSICMLTQVAEECAVPFTLRPIGVNTTLNYFQVFTWGFEDNMRRKKLVKYYGNYDPYEEEMRRVMGGSTGGRKYTGTLPLLLERTLFYGIPSPGGNTGDASMGGINSFPINQFVTADFSLQFIVSVARQLYMNGAKVSSLKAIISPALAEIVSGWGLGTVQTTLNDSTVGIDIKNIVTPYGKIQLIVHRHLRPNEMYLLDIDTMGILTGWDWTEGVIPQDTLLCELTQIHGCFTFALACACHSARIRVDSNCLPAYMCDTSCGTGEIDTDNIVCEPGVVVI